MRFVVVVACVLVSACVQTAAVQCDDGRTCPVDFTCTSNGCLSPSQVNACANRAENDACDMSGVSGFCREGGCVVAVCGNGVAEADEVCDDGNEFSGDGCNGTCSSDETCGNGLVELEEQCDCGATTPSMQASCEGTLNGGTQCTTTCVIARCGNGVMDPGELCDDGNGVGGDGCSYDCQSNETCGNGKLDFFAGEQCDDGNERSIDGCSPSCKVERTAWRALDVASPPALANVAGAYDTLRRVFVVFGGQNSGTQQDATWELDGSTWRRVNTVIRPAAREGSAMAYDPKKRKFLLFGGVGGSTVYSDTWEFDGAAWKQLAPANSPPTKWATRMVYDSARERMVLFAGQSNYCCTRTADTWEWDGTNWASISTTGAIPARAHHAMGYDPIRGRVIVYGGIENGGSNPLGDAWAYTSNGTTGTWTDLALTNPAARYGASFTFDVKRGALVMAGSSETWTLTAAGWSQIGTADPDRRFHTAGYDTARAKVIIFGGNAFNGGAQSAVVSELGATAWAPATLAEPANIGNALAFDIARGCAVLVGGLFSTSPVQTWELRRNSWKQVMITGPTPRAAHMIAYDARRGVTVLYGGSDGTGTKLQDTWEYNGAAGTWSQVTTANSPPGLSGSAMVYDPIHSKIVIWGGAVAGVPTNEMYEYNGTNWAMVPLTTKPGARQQHSMAYDIAHQRLVVIGGTGYPRGETWVYEAAGWRKLASLGPTMLNGGAMTYDTARQRVVLHGGYYQDRVDETWELVGDTWELVIPPLASDLGPKVWSHSMVYDTMNRRTILNGGSTPANTPLTWFYAAAPLEIGEVCTRAEDNDGDGKVGCADDDCWGNCTPNCSPDVPAAACSMTPRCGDGTCNGSEDCRLCPSDCAVGTSACPIECGDGFCDNTETAVSCPGDCG